jgi:prepilin-type processing-associated H-X9-DG protein
LIELLAVIAIIAVLAALLLPTLSRAKHAADSAACRGNLRQWGLALRMHVDELGVYPEHLWASSLPLAEAGAYWYDQLAPYAGTPRFPVPEHLPSMPREKRGIEVGPGYAHVGGRFWPKWMGGYGYNAFGGCGPPSVEPGTQLGLGGKIIGPPTGARPIKDNEVAAPSEMLAIGDALLWPPPGWSGSNPAAPGLFAHPILSPNYAVALIELGYSYQAVDYNDPAALEWCLARLKRRHAGRWNVVLCDGHVENLKSGQLFDPRRDEVLRRWNRDNLPHRELVSRWLR